MYKKNILSQIIDKSLVKEGYDDIGNDYMNFNYYPDFEEYL